MGDRMIDDKEALLYAYFIDMSMNNTMAAALFRRDLFDDIKFPEGALSIDLQVMPFVLTKCEVYQQIDAQLYNAVQYPNSVSRGGFSENMYKDRMSCNKLLDNFFEKHAPNLREYMFYRKSSMAASMYHKISGTKEFVYDKAGKLQELRKLFSENYPLFRKSFYYSDFSKKKKIRLGLFNIHPKLYIAVLGFYAKYKNVHL